MGDLLSSVLGIGSNVKNFLKQKVKKLWDDTEEEAKQHVAQPIVSFAKKANQAVQRTGSAIGDAGIKYGIEAPIKMADNIGEYGLQVATGKRDILPTMKYSEKFKDAPKTNIAKGVYNFGAGVVNAVGSEGVIRPLNDTVDNAVRAAYKQPLRTREEMQSGAGRLGMDLAGGAKPQQFLADIGKTVLPILNAWGGGKVATAFEGKTMAKVLSGEFGQELQRQALKKVAIESAKTGGKLGGAFGLLQGFVDNENQPITKQLINAGLSAVIGATGGAAIGFATPYAGKEISSIIRDTKELRNPTKRVVTKYQYEDVPGVYVGPNGQLQQRQIPESGVKSVETLPFEPKSATFRGLKKLEGKPVGLSIEDITKGMSPDDYKMGKHLTEIENADLTTPELKRKLFQLTEGNDDPALIKEITKEIQDRVSQGEKYYHGSPKAEEIKKTGFNVAKPGENSGYPGVYGEGVYLTNEAGRAKLYGDVLQVKHDPNIKLFEPTDVTAELFGPETKYGDPKMIKEYVQKMGYDGVRMKGKNGAEEIVIFDPSKVNVYSPENAPVSPVIPKNGTELPKQPEIPGVTPNQAELPRPKSAEEIIAGASGGNGKIPPNVPRGTTPAPEIPGQNKKLANLGLKTDKLKISDEAKQTIEQGMGEIEGKLAEKGVGNVMGKEEMQKAAEATAQTLKKTLDRETTVQLGAEALNLRQKIATLAEEGKMTPELMDALRKDKEFSANTARLLQQRSIEVAPGEKNAMVQMIEAVNSKVDDLDAVLKAAEGVDFNDANQAAIFYRQFVKPKVGDWLDLLRYNSMLSSPLTHIVNISSNLVNSGVVAPIEKSVAGTVDFFGSKITGKERTQFAGEGAQHLKGYASSLPEAASRFVDVMRGVKASTNLDTKNIPLHPEGGLKGGAEKALSLPLRLLEGMDQFFTALTEGGERAALEYRAGKGVAVKNMEEQVRNKAAYRIFRQDLHTPGQGTVLDAVDTVTGMVMRARNSENPIIRNIAKWTVPFVKTPMNIFKQGIEYSPAGFATLHGAENKVEQVAKAAVGSAIFAGAAMLLESDRLTWAEPINEKEKNAFRAAGKQPYSVKLGDTWYSYQKLPPGLSFSLALVASIDDTQKNAKLGDDAVDQILTAVSKYGQFLADQSYAKSIGDLLTAAKGGESGITRLLGNYPQQVVPYRALGGWLARLTDDVQRKVDPKLGFIDKQVQMLMQNIPGLSDNTPARMDEFGNEIEANNNIINSFSPVRTSTENEKGVARYDKMMAEKQENSRKKQLKDAIKNGESIVGLVSEGKSKELQDLGDAGDYIYAYDLEKYIGENKESGIKRYTRETEKATVARNIMEGTATYKDIPEEVKPAIYEAMGLDQQDVEYDYMANQPTNAVSQYLLDEMSQANLDHDSVVRALVNGRRASISGKMMVSNAVVDEMYKAGMITSGERTALKKVKLGQNGENQSVASGSGGTRKKSVSALITALKNGPKLEGGQKISSKSKVEPIKVPKSSGDTQLSKRDFKVAPLTIDKIIQNTVNPMAGTSIAKAKALVAGSGGGAPGSNLKLSSSFYRGGRK